MHTCSRFFRFYAQALQYLPHTIDMTGGKSSAEVEQKVGPYPGIQSQILIAIATMWVIN